jgi:hypothetical protein
MFNFISYWWHKRKLKKYDKAYRAGKIKYEHYAPKRDTLLKKLEKQFKL